MHIRAGGGQIDRWLEPMLQLLTHEAREARDGSGAMVPTFRTSLSNLSHFGVFQEVVYNLRTMRGDCSPPDPTYRSQVLDHLGLVAGMFDALGIGNVIDHATYQNPDMRDLPAGEALKAMVLNGLGFIHHALSLVPRCFQDTPTSRLILLAFPRHSAMMRPSVGLWIPSMPLG